MMAIDILVGILALAALTMGVGIGAVIGAGTSSVDDDISFVIKKNKNGRFYSELKRKSTGEVLFRSGYLRHHTTDKLKQDGELIMGREV